MKRMVLVLIGLLLLTCTGERADARGGGGGRGGFGGGGGGYRGGFSGGGGYRGGYGQGFGGMGGGALMTASQCCRKSTSARPVIASYNRLVMRK